MLRLLRGFTLIANDIENLHIEIEELKMPTLEEKSHDFTPGGGTGEIAVPLGVTNKLEMPFKTLSHNPAIDALSDWSPAFALPSPVANPCLMMRTIQAAPSKLPSMSRGG